VRFKHDEHFDARLAALVAEGGHDVETVVREGLGGADDDAVYNACRREERTLVTLDLDFSNPLRFPPGVTEGIVVVRPPRNVLAMIRSTLASAWPDLKSRSLNFRALSMAGLRLPSCLDRCRLGSRGEMGRFGEYRGSGSPRQD
jgi:predicted nuclease of predicted toxin-antitoxin system